MEWEIWGDSSPICKRHLESMLKRIKSYLCLVQTGHVDVWAWERKYSFWHRPLILTAGYPKALIPLHVPNNIICLCVSPLSFHVEILYQHGQSALDTSRTLFLLTSRYLSIVGSSLFKIHMSVHLSSKFWKFWHSDVKYVVNISLWFAWQVQRSTFCK
jgi:hypothetical protein